MMSSNKILLSLLGLLAWAIAAHAEVRKPNVIVIVADDLGYADLGCQGSKDAVTPHIDSIAKNGVRFTSGYVSCPVCSPSRAGLMTGRYQQRFGHEFNPGPPHVAAFKPFGLSHSETTLPQRMKQAGYVTGMVGKWHLGYSNEFLPYNRGFDEFFGFPGGAHSYLDWDEKEINPIMRGKEVLHGKDFLTETFAHEAASFIGRHQKEPFFLYVPFNAVHTPMEVLERYRQRFDKIKDKKRQTFLAMLSALDDGVGEVLNKVHECHLDNDSLIFFFSDNGGPTAKNTSRNDPLRGVKSQVWEGGIRIPFMVQWKGHLAAGTTYDKPVIALDIHATAAAVAEASVPEKQKLDGVNLIPYLTAKTNESPHEFLFWRYGRQWAVRNKQWKLVHYSDETGVQLFDLTRDVGETSDLAGTNPEVVKTLQVAWSRWNAELIAPMWQSGGE
jgi:arylsulfatase A-like enzyme